MVTSLTRKRTLLGLYRRHVPWVIGGFKGAASLMGEVPLYANAPPAAALQQMQREQW